MSSFIITLMLMQPTVDGTYVILAYEKYGQVVPGMVTGKVVISNNILSFPGDSKTPGKQLQLSFGPNNTISITPLDGNGKPLTLNPPNGIVAGGGQPLNMAEKGVYVLSTDFFCINVFSSQPQLSGPPLPQNYQQPPVTSLPKNFNNGTLMPQSLPGSGVVNGSTLNPTLPYQPSGIPSASPCDVSLILKRVAK